MKAHKEKPATDRNGRRSKFWNGWTPRVIAAHIGLLERHTPCAFYSLIYPRRNAPKLHLLRLGMSRLNKAVTDACHRYGYLGAWCLFYENGSKTRHHFHLWFTEPPSAALQAAVCKYWLKHTGQTDNATKVFHASGPARAVGDVKSYLSKHHKNGWLTKAPQVFLLDPKLRFKPFSFHKGKPLAGKLAPAALGARPKLTPGSASGSDFSPGKVTFSEGSFPPLQKASSVCEGTGRVNGVEHIDYPSSEGGYGMGKGDRPSGPCAASIIIDP